MGRARSDSRAQGSATEHKSGWSRVPSGPGRGGGRAAASIEPVLVAPLRGGIRSRRRRWRLLPVGSSAVWARRLLLGGLAIAVAIRLGAIALDPILAACRSTQEIRELNAEYDEARARNERLRRQIAYLSSRSGIEEEARRLGWVRAGEQPLRIVVQEPPPATPSESTPTHWQSDTATEQPSDSPTKHERPSEGTPVSYPKHAVIARAPGDPAVFPGAGPSPFGRQGLGAVSAVPPRRPADPQPRTTRAEQIQQAIAVWSATKWLGEWLTGKKRR